MKARIESRLFCPPLLFPEGERIEVRGSENGTTVKAANPHPTLSLEKGEGSARQWEVAEG